MKAFRIICVFILPILIIGFIVSTLYKWNYIQHTQHPPSDFNIPTQYVGFDVNKNRVDDSKDVLQGAENYIARNPNYEALKEYPNGYPTGNYGQAGDVIAVALQNAGFDLQKLINQDIEKNPDIYGDNQKGKNLAFRIVDNQRIFFSRYATSVTTDYTDIMNWQAGDVIFFEKNHAAIVTDKVNDHGIRFIIHHFWQYQAGYFQDVLETEAWGKIVGHYRLSKNMLTPKAD